MLDCREKYADNLRRLVVPNGLLLAVPKSWHRVAASIVRISLVIGPKTKVVVLRLFWKLHLAT